MDTSEKYIEMCRKASEIQDKWLLDVMDFLYYPDVNEVIVWTLCDDNAPPMPDKPVWLPRQDQLQDMVKSETTFCLSELDKFVYTSAQNELFFYSWEQLWLAFVMYSEFGKAWHESVWVIA